jgi:hypothetical protein
MSSRMVRCEIPVDHTRTKRIEVLTSQLPSVYTYPIMYEMSIEDS